MDDKDIRKKTFSKARRIVVKVGSSILASPEKGLHHEIFSRLAKEISELKRQGHEIVVVSSGAIAAGMEKLGYKTRPQSITQKQATAAVLVHEKVAGRFLRLRRWTDPQMRKSQAPNPKQITMFKIQIS